MSRANPPVLHPLNLTSFTFDRRLSRHSLQIVAKRYSLAEASNVCSPGEYTIILTSGIGSGTEIWIPTIKRLYDLQSRRRNTVRIGNIWAVESQNQGDAAVLNEDVLKEKYPDQFRLRDYGFAVRSLLASGLVDLQGSKVVGLGHSAGCGALILAIPETAEIPYHAVILVEPALIERSNIGAVFLEKMALRNKPLIHKRRDVWPTNKDAITWLKKHNPWNTWHPEVLQAVSEFGFRTLPTAEHPQGSGVTPKTFKGQEAAGFFNTEDNFQSVDLLGRICSSIPVHIIWAERKDLIPKRLQDTLTDGRPMASISEISDTGHFVPQERPDRLSEMIFALLEDAGTKEAMAKL